MGRKQPGQSFKNGPACGAFREHLAEVRSADPPPRSWAEVEAGFLAAMERFDAEVIAGRASEGERQNGKGDYFNELVADVVANRSGFSLNRRTGVNGLVFNDYNLDVTHPATGVAEILVEAKTMGTPKHRGNEKANPKGRSASADLPKRLREAGFKTIDLKAGFAFHAKDSPQKGPAGSLTAWLKKAKPQSFVLIAARVTDPGDLKRMVADCLSMTQIMDGIGLYCFTAEDLTDPAPRYSPCEVPVPIQLGRVLHDIAEQLGASPGGDQ